MIETWVDTLYRDLDGWIEISVLSAQSQGGALQRRRLISAHYRLEDMDYVSLLSLSDVGADVYIGCGTVSDIPLKGRGNATIRKQAPGVWLDLDIGDDGHASGSPVEGGTENTLRPFASEEEALDLLTACGLPRPGAVLRTGGGLHVWWVVQGGIDLRTDVRGAGLVARVNALVASKAAEAGIKVDATADVCRMLRLPGTMNWKLGGEGREVTIAWLGGIYGAAIPLYTDPDLLEKVCTDAGFKGIMSVRQAGSPIGIPGSNSVGGPPGEMLSVADATTAASWSEYLTPLGWTLAENSGREEVWERPGKTAFENMARERSAVVFADRPEVLIVFSTVTPLPSGAGQKLTKLRAAAWLAYGGDMGEAIRGLTRRAGAKVWGTGGQEGDPRDTIWPPTVVDAAVEALGLDLPWIRTGIDAALARMPEGTRMIGIEMKDVVGICPQGLTWRAPIYQTNVEACADPAAGSE